MGFWRQEYCSDLPFPSPGDHVLSELLTMTHQARVALLEWLMVSLSYTSPLTTTKLWSLKGRMWRTEESVVLQSTGSWRVRHSLATEQEQQSMGQEEVAHLWQEQWVAGVWPWVGRASEGAAEPVDPAVGWSPRTQGEPCLECSMGDPPSSQRAPKVLPLPEEMELVKGALEAADQGHVLPWPHHGPPCAEREGFLDRPGRRRGSFMRQALPKSHVLHPWTENSHSWFFSTLSLLRSLSNSPLSLSYFLSLGLWNCLPPKFFPSCIFLKTLCTSWIGWFDLSSFILRWSFSISSLSFSIIHLSILLSVYISIHNSIYPSYHLSIYPSIVPPSIYLPMYLSTYFIIHVYIHPSFYLPIYHLFPLPWLPLLLYLSGSLL